MVEYPDLDFDRNPIYLADPAPRSYARPQTTSPTRSADINNANGTMRRAHVVDPCNKFMSSGEDGTAESLISAACDCHQSFHWKEIEGMFVVKFNSFG